MLAAGTLFIVAGKITCQRIHNERRATAWMDSEFGRLGKTVDEILSHAGDNLAPNIPAAINYQISRKINRHGVAALSEPERNYHALFEVCRAVRINGFESYFLSPAADDAPAALAGLKGVGAVRRATVFEAAMGVFPNHTAPAQLAERKDVVNRIVESARPIWIRCDEVFKSPDEPLSGLLLSYVKTNKVDFVFR